MSSTDFLILGGGIIGLSIARELKRRFADAEITLLEKEAACGLHASGRNSGVIHAGLFREQPQSEVNASRQPGDDGLL